MKMWNENRKSITAIFIGACIPIGLFYLMEAYTHNAFTEVRPWAQLFNIILLELLFGILLLLTRRLLAALWIETLAALIFGLVNYYVYTFRSSPLVPWDIYSIGTATSVADNYDFSLPGKQMVITIVFLLLLVVEFLFRNVTLKKIKIQKTLIGAVIAAVLLIVFCKRLQNEAFQDAHRLYKFLFTPVFMWQVNGYAVTFAMDLPYLSVDKPDGYQKEEEQKVLESYQDEAEKKDALPNLIVIMDEAFSDLRVLGEFETNEDYMPFFHRLEQGAENTVTGYLNVSVCGGNTANTEFEFLTGNTMAFLPTGSIPYQQYIKSAIPSVPQYLTELGYRTYGMHPYYASGWSRDIVYPLLGFQNQLFLEDFKNKSYLRQYLSDASNFQNIIDIYEGREEGSPAFIFNVTMQNHGSYSEVYDNFTPDITVSGREGYPSLKQYLSLIKETDKELEKLLNYFKQQEERTVIVFFGDHQPNDTVADPVLSLNGMDYRTLTKEETDLRYQVPYLIWANYEMKEETGADTSVNFLAANVFEKAGIPLYDYQNYLLELQENYPIISAQRIVDAQGADVTEQPYDDRLTEYQKLQYYQLFEQ